ncbi:MAG: GNAT family N-acetyltransferase [Chloroflexaceae bacterium]|nr:GNAT family N-acetyltransferase [Chloroflexaceae bacterium]
MGLLPMGQWFGGACVPVVGVNGVGVAPEARGSGVGKAMLTAMLEELHTAGTPLSVLYPATLTFYRRVGYELAGYRYNYELPTAAIETRPSPCELVPVADGDYEAIYAAYAERARRSAGLLERPSFMWRQRLEPEGKLPYRFLAVNQGNVEGYVVYTQGSRTEPITILDCCVLTPEAGRRFLALFAGYRMMIEKLSWAGGATDPLRYLLEENLVAGIAGRISIVRPFEWMLRLVHVPAALAARGYPPGLSAELHLDVRDELLPANNRRFVLHVANGRATVAEGGQGRIGLHVRDLAALYTGFMSPAEQAISGSLHGPPADLALLGALFAGPRPWIADMF